jgi:uncharacterized Fe-S center protein
MTSTVYFLPWDKRDRFAEWMKTINAYRHIEPRQYVAFKMHFGEQGNKGFIRPEMVRPIAEAVQAAGAWPFLTDANTIYVGQRADAVHHLMVADRHGFNVANCGCPVIIADGLRGNAGVDVEVNLKHFKTVSIANALHYADALIFLSHFKGHEISGFGGTLKNMGMGSGTRAGKYHMHDRVHPEVNIEKCIGCETCVKWCSAEALKVQHGKIGYETGRCIGCGECILSCPQDVFHIPWDENTSSVQEKIVEYACGVAKNKKHFHVNVINYITRFCDCYPTKGAPLLPDIGIMASDDPVALDQASADIVNKAYGGDFWKHIFPGIDWTVQLAYAEKIGMGSRQYVLEHFKD